VVGARRDAAPASPGDDLDADRRLAARICAGDDDAFAGLVRTHHALVARTAGRFFRRPEVIEEIVQEVLVKAFRAMPDYRGDVAIGWWLRRITVNACYDELRRRARRRERPVSEVVDDVGAFLADLPADPGAAAPWQREESRQAAEAMLARLAPADRLVLTLTVLDERSVAEVADLTGWSRANVKVRAFRARQRLRRELARAGG